jgi:hypothetical protein
MVTDCFQTNRTTDINIYEMANGINLHCCAPYCREEQQDHSQQQDEEHTLVACCCGRGCPSHMQDPPQNRAMTML